MQSAPEEWKRTCSTVKDGSLGITGVFMQPSAGIFEMGNTAFTAVLDAFGKMHRFEFNAAENQGVSCAGARS